MGCIGEEVKVTIKFVGVLARNKLSLERRQSAMAYAIASLRVNHSFGIMVNNPTRLFSEYRSCCADPDYCDCADGRFIRDLKRIQREMK